ncbi:hypothetical protein DRJ54_04060 [Candidatus Acetothermia bacterium]|nr:MAG: hypothetical protein DRJ54_04060 [Candidatus Acetothermia bacterium]
MNARIPRLFLGEGAEGAASRWAEDLLGAPLDGHPDLLRVGPDGATIRIDRVREAVLWARYAPVRAPVRVILLGPAEQLSHEAASALLKSLEEAPSYLAFVLYARAPDQLIPTVRSRCAVSWAPGGRGGWKDRLTAAGYSQEEAEFLLPFLDSELDLAPFLAERREPEKEWEKAVEELAGVPLEEVAARFVAYLEDPIRRRAAAEALFRGLEGTPADRVLAAAEALARGGREAALALSGELARYLLRRPPGGMAPERLAAWARKASLARGELEANVNVKLLLEVMLLWPRRG